MTKLSISLFVDSVQRYIYYYNRETLSVVGLWKRQRTRVDMVTQAITIWSVVCHLYKTRWGHSYVCWNSKVQNHDL